MNYLFKLGLVLLLIILCQNSLAAGTDDFVIQVKTDFPGTSANNEFTIQTFGAGYDYNVDCDFDGVFEITAQSGNVICSYGSPGIKFIRIEDNTGSGTGFPRIFYDNTGDHRKLTDIAQWGTGKWTSMGAAFRGAINMKVTAMDVPDLSNVTNLASMFRFASLADPDTSNWDVSSVTTMHSMFRSASAAIPDTSNWNTANVTIMTHMFRNAVLANPDVSGWDITQVTDMSLMFANVALPTVDYDAMLLNFSNQNITNAVVFDGGNSQYCSIPAQNARASLIANKSWTITDGNQCLNNDPLNDFVFTVLTNYTPTDPTGFTIPTTGTGYKYNVDCNDDGIYEASGVTGDYTCDYSASGAGTYTIRIQDAMGDKTGFHRIDFTSSTEGNEIIDIVQWGTGIWTTMEGAFTQTSHLQVSAGDAPDLSQVTSLENMFYLSTALTTVGSNWDTSNITNMMQMLYFAVLAQPQTGSWDTSNVTNMTSMFYGANSAQPDTSNWNTANVKFMPGMFFQAYAANPDTSGWNIEQVTAMDVMFFDVTLPTSDYDSMLNGFNSQILQSGVTFHGGNSKYCDITAHDGLEQNHNWTIADGGLDPTCPDPVDDFVIMVKTDNQGTSSDTQFTIPTLGTGYNYNVDCDDDNPGINIASAQTGNYICGYVAAGTYTVRISDNVGDKTGFPRIYFNSERDYRKIIDLKQWGSGIWTNMASAFSNTSNMIVSATDSPNLSQVINAISMFSGAGLANPNTTNWNVSNIQMMQSMFRDATSANPDTSLWDTSSLTSTFSMFNGATTANPNVQSWDVTNVTNMGLMFEGVTMPLSSFDALLNHFNSQAVVSGITFSGGNSTYCNVAAHDNLTNVATGHGWTITDGGLDPSCTATPADDFVISVQTDIAGATNPLQFTIPTSGTGYNYNVDCNDDNPGTNTATAQTGDYICNYAVAGTYTIRISDNIGDKTGFPRIYALSNDDIIKVVDLKQWGTGFWSSMGAAFSGASNMTITATDVPDLSQVINAVSMFFGASLANPNTTNWNVSNIQFMQSMFRDATTANPDTTNWNVSNVTSMFLMFKGATSANPNVGSWNTANVSNMVGIFQNSTSAMPDISAWDISGVTVPSSMDFMLSGVSLPTALYDTTLANFDSQVTANGIVFDGGNSKYCNIAARDSLVNKGWTITDGGLDPSCPTAADDFVIEVDTTITGSTSNTQFEINTNGSDDYNYNVDCDNANAGINTAFAQSSNFICNYAAPGIYIIRITDNSGSKSGFPEFRSKNHMDAKKIINLKQWGTGIWESMTNAFNGASNMVVTATDIPDLSNVFGLNSMFEGANLANPDVSQWNTSHVSFMNSMFAGAITANPNVSSWNTASVTAMSDMFNGATSATPNISQWDISSITTPFSMENMFSGVSLPTSLYDATLANFNSQITANGIIFDGGNSKYCNVAARDGLINNHGWTITDGGLDANCPVVEDIFSNGFEDVIIFKAAQSQLNYDFSEVSINDMDEQPLLIAQGINEQHKPVIHIYLRNDVGQLQIRLDKFDVQDSENIQWTLGQWQSIDNANMTMISW